VSGDQGCEGWDCSAAFDFVDGDADAAPDAAAAQLAGQTHEVSLLATCTQQFRRLFHAACAFVVRLDDDWLAVECVGQREHGGGHRVFGVKKVLSEQLLDLGVPFNGGEIVLGDRAAGSCVAARSA